MENASKALLMAGGILIALMIIGALVLMVNQIGSYQKSQQDMKENSQLAKFNLDFEKYIDDKGIKGTDIVSLINKIIDYNAKAANGGTNNSVDYSIKMSITVKGLTEFNQKYAYNNQSDNNSLFPMDIYTLDNTSKNNEIKTILENFAACEKSIGIEKMKQLSAIYDPTKNENTNKNDIKNKLIEINSAYQNWNGRDPDMVTIKKYRQYSEFKSSTFVISQSPKYEKGQIKDLYFKFDK